MDKGWSNKPDFVALWVHLLMLANHNKKEYFWNGRTIILNPGQFITGRKSLSEKSGINESKVERILKCFESEQQIEQQTTSTSRCISIKNWVKFQKVEQQYEQRVNNGRTTSEQRVNTKEELKNDKNVKNERRKEEFTPPQILEVIEYFKSKGFPETIAKVAFEFYDTANWHDSRGAKVRNWKQKMLSVWMKEENKAPKLTPTIGRSLRKA